MRDARSIGGTLLLAVAAGLAQADEMRLPAPRATIYPGDIITDGMLIEQSFSLGDPAAAGVVHARSEIVGKMAKRTLLPAQPIQAIAIDAPRLVTAGARVRLIFSEAGLTITASGIALQPGAVGDVIRVRNPDSGLTVTGRVRADGTVVVSEG